MTLFTLRTGLHVASAAAVVLLAACSGDVGSISGLSADSQSATLGRADNRGDKLPAPAGITAVVSGQSIVVRWSAVSGAGEYKAQLCSVDGACRSARTAALTASFTDVAPGSYSVVVRARRDAPANVTDENNGWGDAGSAGAVVAALPAAPPVTPKVQADVTPPIVTYAITGTLGSNGWYTSAPVVTWTVTDAESAVASSCPASAVTTETTPTGIDVSCTATSAGGTTARSVNIRYDATAPLIAFSGSAPRYTVDQTVSISCTVSDQASGVATRNCTGVTSDAYLLTLGANSTTGTAADHAGNARAASQGFEVAVDFASLCALTRRFVTNAGIANSLCVKLDAASRATARGNLQARAGSLGAYMNEVNAQGGKWIPADKVPHLLRLAAAL